MSTRVQVRTSRWQRPGIAGLLLLVAAAAPGWGCTGTGAGASSAGGAPTCADVIDHLKTVFVGGRPHDDASDLRACEDMRPTPALLECLVTIQTPDELQGCAQFAGARVAGR